LTIALPPSQIRPSIFEGLSTQSHAKVVIIGGGVVAKLVYDPDGARMRA
jgi:hypothetical protein